MGKPRLIILIRHAQSEGNKNRDIHQTIPDHRVKLTQDGWQQAYEAGRRLRAMLRPEDTLHFFTSPYRRTRETTEGILATLTSDEPQPSPFKRDKIKVYEEPRLREQDFGNFQPCSAEMERMWQERADYGHFFYRIPNGESAADAYDRISGFNESLWRQFGEDDFASVCVLVTHGLMSRVFLMKWYHFSVEYFEDLRNVNHCEFLIMKHNDETGKYILENKLRTWSALKRERAALLAKENGEDGKDGKDGKENGNSKDVSTLSRAATIETRRRWGGCPDGCNHDKSFKIRQTLADLVKSDSVISNRAAGLATSESGGSSMSGGSNSTTVPNGASTHAGAGAGGSTHGIVNPSFNGTANSQTLVSRRPAAKRFQSQTPTGEPGEPQLDCATVTGPQIDVTKARDEVVSSPDGTPSFISVDDRLRARLKSPNFPPRPLDSGQLHVGRDFGGTYSGHSSAASDDTESSSDDDDHAGGGGGSNLSLPLRPRDNVAAAAAANGNTNGNGNGNGSLKPHHDRREQSRMGRGMRANRLGDYHSSDGEHDADGEHEPGGADVESGSELTRSVLVNGDENGDGEDPLLKAEREDRSIRGSVY
ncbi:Broad-range acid phosphatase productT1 [Madurella fahalii]|uniref:Broad-range acid phosphatase productT1 n=1 Tax=Madurella fahalii TaxID=1157608 RepID=A0ABQ0G6C5_9PEZI